MREAMKQIKGAVAKKPTVPVLGYILFSCTDEHLDLTAVNNELGIAIRCEILGPGKYPDFRILLSPDRLARVLEGARSDQISFTLAPQEEKIKIVSGHSRFEWPLADALLFPVRDWLDADDGYQVLSAEFRNLIERCVFAGDENSTRFALGGICLETTEVEILGIATDGRRMSMQSIRTAADNPLPEDTDAPILPIKSAKVLEKLLENDEHADILFVLNERQEPVGIEVHCGLVSFSSQLVSGKFPDRQMVLERSNPITHASVKTNELLWLIKQSAVGTNEESCGIELSIQSDKIIARAEAFDAGSAYCEVDLLSFEGTPCKTKLDRDFLLQLLEAMDKDTVLQIGFTENHVGDEEVWSPEFTIAGSGFTHYLFPMGRPS
jgi:DNA polymerase-3 subunit beta